MDLTRNVSNQESVSAHRHSLLMPQLEISARVLAKDSLAELTPNVVPRIPLNVCVKLDSKEILSQDASALMNVIMHPVLMVLSALARKEDTSVFARKEWLVIHTKLNVSMKTQQERITCAKITTIAHQTCTAKIVIVSALAQTSLAERMLIVTPKIMPDGAVVELDSLKDQMVAYQNVKDIFAVKVLYVSSPLKDQLVNVQQAKLVIHLLEDLAGRISVQLQDLVQNLRLV